MKRNILFLIVVTFFFSTKAYSQNTQIVYLSRTDAAHTTDWDFFCSDGMNTGKWIKIPVPSNWELQDFGTYNYGNVWNKRRRGLTVVKEHGLFVENYIKFDDTRQTEWSKEFEIVEIKSSKDNSLQKSYFYKSKSDEPQPLIVSLHTWSGYYNQIDGLAEICKQRDFNYIHPDFRGANITVNACCSELALSDIDDAITFAINNSNVDTTKIFVIGVSGGGYATLSTFMKSKHYISKFSAWASITDLIAWYNESKIRNNKYAEDILNCTGSKNGLNIENAKQKSPIYWNTPTEKLQSTKLTIYAGVYDGIQGSVPITHSINFYNKLLSDMSISDTSRYVTDSEKLRLLEKREPIGEYGEIADRKICLKKQFGNLSIIIFEGNHEMLTEFAFNELLEE